MWTIEAKLQLIELIQEHGEQKWSLIGDLLDKRPAVVARCWRQLLSQELKWSDSLEEKLRYARENVKASME